MIIDWNRIYDEHLRVGELMDDLERITAKPTPESPEVLTPLRTSFRSFLIAHLKYEDWVIYPALQKRGDGQLADMAHAFIKELGQLAEAFNAYCSRWMEEDIVADWKGYCLDTRALIGTLRYRIARENGVLYPSLRAAQRAA